MKGSVHSVHSEQDQLGHLEQKRHVNPLPTTPCEPAHGAEGRWDEDPALPAGGRCLSQRDEGMRRGNCRYAWRISQGPGLERPRSGSQLAETSTPAGTQGSPGTQEKKIEKKTKTSTSRERKLGVIVYEGGKSKMKHNCWCHCLPQMWADAAVMKEGRRWPKRKETFQAHSS